MRLGAAWSPLLQGAPEIIEQVDYVQLSVDHLWRLDRTPDRPIILHGHRLQWSLAAPDAVSEEWLNEVRRALEETGSPWFSLHLGFASERVSFDTHMLPESEPLARVVLAERFIEALERIRSDLPVPLAVENLDYCPEGAYEHVCDPTFISEVVAGADVGLLLDIGHLQVSASWLGFDPEAALDRTPIDRVREIHLSSPRPLHDGSGRLDDVHERLNERDYSLLQKVLNRCAPSAITLEYRRDHEELVSQIQEIRRLLDDRESAVTPELR